MELAVVEVRSRVELYSTRCLQSLSFLLLSPDFFAFCALYAAAAVLRMVHCRNLLLSLQASRNARLS